MRSSLATATICGSFGCSSASPVAARQTSSLGMAANLKPSTSSRSQAERRSSCCSNAGSCAPRSSCISTQRRDEVTRTSAAPAWRWRHESLPGWSTSNVWCACLISDTARQRRSLLLAAGKPVRRHAVARGKPGPGEGFGRQGGAALARHAAAREPIFHVVCKARPEKIRLLMRVHDLAAPGFRVRACRGGLARPVDKFSFLGRVQARQHAQQGRLAAAIGPDEDIAVPGLELERRGVEQDALAEALDDALGLEERAHSRPPSPCSQASATLTPTAMTISTKPSAMPYANSPLEVSSAIAVVVVRVRPSILPATSSAQPTSDTTRPKALTNPAVTAKRTSHSVVPIARSGRAPRQRAVS